MPSELQEILPLLVLLALLGGLAGGSTGFGIYLVIGPALWSVLEPTESMGFAISVAMPAWALLIPLRRSIPWKKSQLILLWAVPGLGAGLLGHLLLDSTILQASAALAILAAVGVRYKASTGWSSAPSGLLAGTLSTSVGFNGPPVFLAFAGAPERVVRSGTILCLLVLSLAASLVLLLADKEEFLRGYLSGLLFMPLTGIGVLAGHLLALRAGKQIEWVAVAVSLGGALLLLLRSLGI